MKKTDKKISRAILRVVILSLCGVILGLNLYTWNAGRVLGEQMPMPFGIGVSVVLTGSMEPALHAGDLIVVKATDEIYERQVVVFEDGGSLVVHRVIAFDGETVTTQGDANNVADAPVAREAIKGELMFSVPLVGHIVLLLREPLAVVIVLAGAIFLVEFSYRKEKKKSNDELDKIKEEIRALSGDLKNEVKNKQEQEDQTKDA